ncbi:MAG: hypothetical protein K2R98_06165 [Gemmataceae bacterium]|nr:hypothetical protein [Gemmataceae bacterium]
MIDSFAGCAVVRPTRKRGIISPSLARFEVAHLLDPLVEFHGVFLYAKGVA